jgi:hypothetical protein
MIAFKPDLPLLAIGRAVLGQTAQFFDESVVARMNVRDLGACSHVDL